MGFIAIQRGNPALASYIPANDMHFFAIAKTFDAEELRKQRISGKTTSARRSPRRRTSTAPSQNGAHHHPKMRNNGAY